MFVRKCLASSSSVLRLVRSFGAVFWFPTNRQPRGLCLRFWFVLYFSFHATAGESRGAKGVPDAIRRTVRRYYGQDELICSASFCRCFFLPLGASRPVLLLVPQNDRGPQVVPLDAGKR